MTYRCAVLGNPIAHSRSPEIHAALARDFAVDLQYERILVPEGEFARIVRQFFAAGGRGLNITLPYKQAAYALADRCTAYAKRARATNTLWMHSGKLCAENTDGRGLVDALQKVHLFPLHDRRVLLLGAGGAARGVVLPLLESGVARLDIMNRTLAKAHSILEAHRDLTQVPMQVLPFGETPARGYDLILNATSAGLSGKMPALPETLIADRDTTFCYDMVYGIDTPFLQWAKNHGVSHVADGDSMLKRQAELSFRIWFSEKIAG